MFTFYIKRLVDAVCLGEKLMLDTYVFMIDALCLDENRMLVICIYMVNPINVFTLKNGPRKSRRALTVYPDV